MQLGGYHELRLLHRGRRHLAFRGRSLHDDRPVVVKTVEPGAPATALRHEHALLATLDLDGVVRLLALRWLGETPALVLSDAGPHNLREWLQRRPLEVGAFWSLALDLAGILAELHARGVIHRDVTPSNIVVGADGRTVTLVDFDAATSTAAAPPARAADESEGRLLYLAAEQAGRTGAVVDHRADLYALGATFYEMLTGAPPFPAGNPGELVHAHLARAPVAPSAVNPALPRPLSDLVLRLLAKSADERHPSAEALLADLEACRGGGAITAPGPEPRRLPDLISGDPARVVNLELAEPGPGGPRSLDLLGLLKAAETISREVVLERLLEKLLAVCFEVAGATRGALALDEEGTLVVQAAGAVGEPVSLARTPLADSSDLPRALVQLCHGAEDPLVLAAAARSSPVAEPCFAARGTRSVLLLPIRQQGRALGVLYLENHLVENAFSAERVRVLQLLSSQVAISVENARLYRQAQDSIRQREEFLSVASHELQTPLAALQLAVQGILHGLEPGSDARLQRAGRVAARQTERLSALIDELLDLSRIRSGHLTMHLEPVDLTAVVRAVSDRFGPQAEEAGCLVRLSLPGPAVGRWDRRRVEQVVTNLLSNAVKFGRGHPIDLEVHNTGAGSALAVTDRGVGIPDDRIGRLFQRFERGSSSPSAGGLGLGLYITREIVTGLGGAVSVESQPGAGATFTVELPRGGPT